MKLCMLCRQKHEGTCLVPGLANSRPEVRKEMRIPPYLPRPLTLPEAYRVLRHLHMEPEE